MANPSSSVAAGDRRRGPPPPASQAWSGSTARGSPSWMAAYGLADRRLGVAMTTTTRLGIASGTKAFTAVVVMQLVAEGALVLATRVRDVLGADLPLVRRPRHGGAPAPRTAPASATTSTRTRPGAPRTTSSPCRSTTLTTTEDTWAVLDGIPQVFEPGERCTYNNSAFVVLALRRGAGGRPCPSRSSSTSGCAGRPAGMAALGLPALRRAARPTPLIGYLWQDSGRGPTSCTPGPSAPATAACTRRHRRHRGLLARP